MPDSGEPVAHRRTVRSFVRRHGRMTAGQRRAIDNHWARYGVEFQDQALDLDALFGRRAPRLLEIGFGMGEALQAMSAVHPENDYLGIEVYLPGVGRLLNELAARNIGNVRVICQDAVVVLERMIPDAALDGVFLFFPDPWPKKRHHKRRLLQSEFAALLARKLKPGGFLHAATDWEDYAEHMLAVLERSPHFTNAAGPGRWSPRPDYRPLTKFERRGQRLGHGVWDLVFRKRQD